MKTENKTVKLMQAPPLTDYEAATAKVIGPDAVDEARTLQGKYRVYEVDPATAKQIIEENKNVHNARYTYLGDEQVKGVCYIDEQVCGCVFEIDEEGTRGATFQRCQEHATHRKELWCCEKSVTYSCVCFMAQWCPDHGDQHAGTHD